MDSLFLISTFVTLFVILDPFALTPMFVALTKGMDSTMRRAIALRACVTGMIVLMAFAAFGEALLGLIGISMHAFRIAGGMLLFLTALEMLFERRSKRREGSAEEEEHPDPSVFPLAIPLIAGPGAIASVILLTGQQPGWGGFLAVVGMMIVVIVILFFFLLSASLLERALGKTGINILTRLFGMLLAALAVQFVLDGLRGFGLSG